MASDRDDWVPGWAFTLGVYRENQAYLAGQEAERKRSVAHLRAEAETYRKGGHSKIADALSMIADCIERGH